jgi:Cu/Ag efflux protein CusF
MTKLIFEKLYECKTEQDVERYIKDNPQFFKNENWKPIGGTESNFSIIENQQSNPIAALVEKVTNSIDAILMKKCLELNLDPKDKVAPKSMDDAIDKFYGKEAKNWDLRTFRRSQSEEIQILSDGPTKESAVIIYDNGEGQNPEKFEDTFLSLMRGNKNEIQFVQGKYNMGGSGAIVFCGKLGFQLIGSRRFDKKGEFGFTLVREHPLSKVEQSTKKNTWYEYLTIDGKIPSFQIDKFDLRLHGRQFETGTIIKMFSYQMKGVSGFAQDLSQNLNEFLFKPVLPLLTVDNKERYPNNEVLESTVFGLQRRLEEDGDNYVEDWFSENYSDSLFGKMKVTCYVFKAKRENRSVKQTKDDIRRNFFKNGMSVLFSMNGQVHGHYTTEFITKGLKFNLLKDYLLINIDCTHLNYEFRKELFMASRDRLRQGDESNKLREYLRKKLTNSKLVEINKARKDSIGLESEDTQEMVKSFAKNLPKDGDLFKLLQNTLKIEEKDKSQKPASKAPQRQKALEKEFKPERYPSFFRLYNRKDESQVFSVPIGGEKTLKFETDVEDHYFDRVEDPGELQVSVLNVKRKEQNETSGGDKPGSSFYPGDLINVVTSSPDRGTIKITINPNTELRQGDEIEVKASLKGPGETFQDEVVFLKIVDPETPSKQKVKVQEDDMDSLGLPELVKVSENEWDNMPFEMDHKTVMFPLAEGDKLEKIFINLDSSVFLNHRKKLTNEEQISVAQRKYLASVYFHALFLYMTTKNKGYNLQRSNDGEMEDMTIADYVSGVFDSFYSDFLLNFGMESLLAALED